MANGFGFGYLKKLDATYIVRFMNSFYHCLSHLDYNMDTV